MTIFGRISNVQILNAIPSFHAILTRFFAKVHDPANDEDVMEYIVLRE